MVKSELINIIAEQNPHLRHADAEQLVNVVLERVVEALAAGDRVEIRGFGTFSIRLRAARNARNPRTGEAVAVDGKAHLVFKQGREMGRRLNGVEAAPAEGRAPLRRVS